MNCLQFELEITPQPKLRARMTRGGNIYTPEKTRAYEAQIAVLVRSKLPPGFRPIEDLPVNLSCSFVFKHSKVSLKEKRTSHIVRPDLDNLGKAVKDALNKVVWHDDSQIDRLFLTKEYGDKDLVWIGVSW